MTAADHLELRITADAPLRLAEAARQVGAFLDQHHVGARAHYAADLALEELGTNILAYGFPAGVPAGFLLRVTVRPAQIELVFEDRGRAFDPTGAPAPNRPRPWKKTTIGGLGIHMVRQLVERLHYARTQDGNRLVVEITNPT